MTSIPMINELFKQNRFVSATNDNLAVLFQFNFNLFYMCNKHEQKTRVQDFNLLMKPGYGAKHSSAFVATAVAVVHQRQPREVILVMHFLVVSSQPARDVEYS